MRESPQTFPFSIQNWARLHPTVEVVDKHTFEVELQPGTGLIINVNAITHCAHHLKVVPKEISFPPLAEWTVEDVCIWLQTLKVSQDYSQNMKDEAVDGIALMAVKTGRMSLQEYGIVRAGDRAKVLESLENLK